LTETREALQQQTATTEVLQVIAPLSPSPSCTADRLADGVLDDADAQRLQLAVKLTGE